MVEIKIINRMFFFFLFLFVSCKKENYKTINIIDNQDSAIVFRKRIADSISLRKKNKKQYPITIAHNKKFVAKLVFEKIKYNNQNDLNNIVSVLLKTPIVIDYTYLRKNKANKNGISFKNFGLQNYLEYKEPFIEYFPFINDSTKKIDFIITYDESTKNSLKISFNKGQSFWFGENFKWITPKIKLPKKLLETEGDYQVFNKKYFSQDSNQGRIGGGDIIEFKNKKYLLFTFWSGMWCIHHLFDVTNETNIKYYILNGIYTDEDGYGDFNNDGQLDFKQKYFYLRNSIDTTQNKYKIYTIK